MWAVGNIVNEQTERSVSLLHDLPQTLSASLTEQQPKGHL